MRILKIEIAGFGHYRQKTIVFDAHNQLFYGENEAGKSTLYQFIYAMLFGFTKKSAKKRDYTPQDGAAYGGRLWFEDHHGQVIKIERFRQIDRGKPKVWIEEQETTQSLEVLLEPLNAQVFQEIYTFQQEQLSQIDRLQERDFHEALLSLGISGSQQLMEVVKQEERTSQLLFRPRGRNLPLNQKIVELERLQEKIVEKEQQEATVQQVYQQLHDLKEKLYQIDQKITNMRSMEQTLEQQRLNWPLYEEWQALNNQALTLVLSNETQQEIEHVYQSYQQLEQSIQQKTDQIARIEQDQTSERYFFYLDHEGEIKQLKAQYFAIMKAIEEEQQALRLKQELDSQLTYYETKWQFKQEVPPQAIDPRIYEDLAQLDQLTNQHQKLVEKISWAKERQDALEQDVARLENRLVGIEPESNSTKRQYLIGAGGGVLGILCLFLNLWLGLGLVVLSGIWTIFGTKRTVDTSALDVLKEQWQEKLAESTQGQTQLLQLKQEQELIVQKLHTIQQRLQPFFGQTPQAQWQDLLLTYEKEAQAYEELVEEVQRVQQTLTEIEPILTQTEKMLRPFYAWFSMATLPLAEQIQMLFTFDEEMQQVKLERSQNPSMQLASEIQRLRAQKTTLLADSKQLFAESGITTAEEIPVILKQWTTRRAAIKRKEELALMLSELFNQTITKHEWQEHLQQTKEGLATSLVEYKEYTTKIQRLELELEHLQQDGTLDEWYQKRTQLEDQVRQLSTKWASQKVHAALLTQLATTRSEAQFPLLIEKVTEYFGILTNYRYEKVLFQEGILSLVDARGQYDVYQLSTGTKDQLIMAFRFAYLALQHDQALCPVIIDDGWLHYDHKRKLQLARLLAAFGESHQVICLSSDREMVSYYKEEQQVVSMLTEGM